ncbi:twitchin-like protein, partial [Leptotrombidium deliense]
LVQKREYKFRVRAVNKKGSSEPLSAKDSIIAKDPYDEPSKPNDLEVVDWDADHVDLKWKAPDRDGGAPIEGYVVEYKDKFSPEWSKGPEVGADRLKATVQNLKEGMQYQFRVKAVNKAGPGEPSDPTKPIIVKARFVKPYIIGDGLKNLIVKKGQVIKYDVQFGGEPPPEVKWFANKNELVSSLKITIEATAKTSLMVVKSAVRADSGKYKLELTNSSGTFVSEADVVVLDKPSPPEGPLMLEEVRADHITVAWRRPKDDGGQDLKGYVIEKMDPDTGRWVPAGEVGPNTEKFTVEGLTKGKKYKFRVKAVNKEGESDPLETDSAVVAKNPYDEPGKPGKPEIVDYDNTKCDLKWAAPENDGGKPITHYIIEMKDKLSKDFVEVMKTSSAKPEATVTGLKQGNVVQFRVRAVNIAGPSEPSDETDAHTVKHRKLKPQIDRSNLKNVTLKVGKGHHFDVDIIGEPPPKITWTFGDDKLKVMNDDHFKIDNVDYHSDFNLQKAERKHSGKYTITATNEYGSDSVSVDVIVIGKPGKPEGPLDIFDVHKEGCKLEWKKPKDDGGVPIKGYEVEKLDPKSGRWTRCGKTDKTELEVTGLTPGKEYLFRVSAINEEGESEPLEALKPIIAKNPYDEPGKPGTPEIVDWDNKSVDLVWEKPASDGGAPITSYIVEKKEKFAIVWSKATEVPGNTTAAKVEELTENQEYQFRVIAVNKAGPGEASEPTKSHLVKHRKLKPYIDRTNLETTTIKKGKSMKLDVNIRGEPPPKVTWKLKDKVITNNEHYEIVNVDYNTKFNMNNGQRIHSGKYTIIAENEHGKDEAEVEIVVLAAPSMPKGPLKVENVHKKGCTLKWEKPEDDGGKPITGYIVEKLDVDSGNWVPVGRTDETELAVSGLTPGKRYKFRVKAVNPEGESEPLVSDLPITAKNPYNEAKAPTDVVVDDWSEKHVDLKWKAPLDDGGAPITGYIIEKKEKYGGSWQQCLTTNTPATTAKVEGLTKGQTYQFRVIAVNKAGPGEPSQPTKPHLAKERNLAPRINRDNLQPITVRAGNTARLDVEVSGEPPPKITWTFAGKPLESGKDLKIENEDYKTNFQLRNTTRAQSGLYKIIATNENGTDEAEVQITVLDKPGKPEGPLEVSNIHAEGCKLTWKPPKDDGGVPVQNYVIEKQDTSTGKWEKVAAFCKATEYNVTGLEPNKRYNFRVMAENECGTSDPLTTESAITAKHPFSVPDPPGKPRALETDAGKITLQWDEPLRDGGAKIEGYQIEYKEPGDSKWGVANPSLVKDNTFTVTGLQPGKKYEFRVKAKNAAGFSEPSTTSDAIKASSMLPDKPGKPEIVDYDNTKCDLKWTAPVNDGGKPIKYYVVEMKDKLSNEFVEVMRTVGPTPEASVTGLKQGNVCQFRVRAVNAAGPSEPSEATDPHTVKHRKLKPSIDRSNLKNITL